MTTGRTCPHCGGITSQRCGLCQACEISAMPPGIGKAVRTAAHRLLYGAPDIELGMMFGLRDAATARDPEAGS
jgi:hypothetical protein